MLWLAALAVVAQVLPFASASPITTTSIETDSSTVSKRFLGLSKWKAEDLNKEFKGIWWNEALSGKDGECSSEQIDKLVYATRASMWIFDAVVKDEEFHNSEAWNRYFRSYSDWVSLGTKYKQVAAKIKSNILQVAKYPRYGHSKKLAQNARVTYTCKTSHVENQRCGKGLGVAASTSEPLGNDLGVWTILFCPLFFETQSMDYVERRTSSRQNSATIGQLDTYERAIIHEFMHVGRFGISDPHVEDVEVKTNGKVYKIYGESTCQTWANAGKAPPLKIGQNADNYAWFFLYFHYDKTFGWSKANEIGTRPNFEWWFKGEAKPVARAQTDPLEPASTVPEENLKESTDMPANCQEEDGLDSKGNKKIHCDYTEGDYEEWIADQRNTYKSLMGCDLTNSCYKPHSDRKFVHPDCQCKCSGQDTKLSDKRCAGFDGLFAEPFIAPTPAQPVPTPTPAPKPAPPAPCAWYNVFHLGC